jgi:5-(carboxyamino)imidazole ribonucleotide mutase
LPPFSLLDKPVGLLYNDADINRVGEIKTMTTSIQVGVIMGSKSDWETMMPAAEILQSWNIPYEARVVSAHRTPELLVSYAKTAVERGLKVIIAGAGGAAHLPGMVASLTDLPVIGVPVQSKALNGLDSLLSIVQMPRGVPVATVAIGSAGAANAALLALKILGLQDPELQKRLASNRAEVAAEVLTQKLELPK